MPETGIGGVILLWGLYDPTENYEERRLGMIVRRTGPLGEARGALAEPGHP